jgi:hypothetical protein
VRSSGAAKAHAGGIEGELERVKQGMQREGSELDRLRGESAASSLGRGVDGWITRRGHEEVPLHYVRPYP